MRNRELEIQELARQLLLNGYAPVDAFHYAQEFVRLCEDRAKEKPDTAGEFFDSVQARLPWLADNLMNRQLVEGYMAGGSTVDQTVDRLNARAAFSMRPNGRPQIANYWTPSGEGKVKGD